MRRTRRSPNQSPPPTGHAVDCPLGLVVLAVEETRDGDDGETRFSRGRGGVPGPTQVRGLPGFTRGRFRSGHIAISSQCQVPVLRATPDLLGVPVPRLW
jgi:hypothetical protein